MPETSGGSGRIFSLLIRLYPPEFRRRFEEELMEFFHRDLAAAKEAGGFGAGVAFWLRTVRDLTQAALRLRWKQAKAGSLSALHSSVQTEVETLAQDLRFALRSLRRKPGFTAVAVAVLGLGIGASTTLFSAVNGVLLRPLPYPEQDRLVLLGSRFPQGARISGMSIPELMDVMSEVEAVEGYAATRGRALDLVGEGEPERVAVAQVSPGYFPLLGAVPLQGRTFLPEEHLEEEARVVMVSDGLWRRRWGGGPDIVGKTLVASDGRTPELQRYTIVGVLPAGFENPPPLEDPYSRLPPADLWTPLPLGPEMYTTSRTHYTIRTVARLRPGATLEGLNAELEALGLALKDAYPMAHLRGDSYLGIGARPLLEEMVGSRRRDLLILLGATGLLLLIACANVAGLLVARALDRTREMGVRAAMGAGRRRLFRQLLTENLALALLGGAVGVAVAFLGVEAFRVLGPAGFPRLSEVEVDLQVLAFGVAVAAATGLLSGVGPALAGSREERGGVLAPWARGGIAGRGTQRLRGGLVAVEVALALVLLTGCGLLARSIVRLQSQDAGLETGSLALMQVRLLPSYDDDGERRTFYSGLRSRLEALPGALSVSYVADPPMGFRNWAPSLWRGEDASREEPTSLGAAHPVGLGYFRTMEIPILRGRSFTEADDENSSGVTVISETLAEAFWPGENAVGKRIGMSIDHDGDWLTVVGVAGDIRQETLASDPVRDFYLPFAQFPGDQGTFMAIRTSGEPLAMAQAFRGAVWEQDPNVPIPEVTTMETRVDAGLRLPRFRALLLAFFAGVALILAVAGVYGTVMYAVGRRTPEVGLRMALGAEAGDVILLVVRQGLGPVLLGVGIGVAGSVAVTRVLESVLFQLSPNDPATFGATAGILLGVSGLACLVPARRASRVDPQEALRAD